MKLRVDSIHAKTGRIFFSLDYGEGWSSCDSMPKETFENWLHGSFVWIKKLQIQIVEGNEFELLIFTPFKFSEILGQKEIAQEVEEATGPPRVPIKEAAHELWWFFFKNTCGTHPYISSIGSGSLDQDETAECIWVMLAREPMHFEKQIPAEWMGYPVETRVTGPMYLC